MDFKTKENKNAPQNETNFTNTSCCYFLHNFINEMKNKYLSIFLVKIFQLTIVYDFVRKSRFLIVHRRFWWFSKRIHKSCSNFLLIFFQIFFSANYRSKKLTNVQRIWKQSKTNSMIIVNCDTNRYRQRIWQIKLCVMAIMLHSGMYYIKREQ